jgi:two-component system response regulator (stage 0 sporulation protein F)
MFALIPGGRTALWRIPKPLTIPTAPSVREGQAPPSLSILVVDDESLIRYFLRRALTKRGHRVTEAANATEALDVLSRDEPFDVVLLDYRLPDRQDSSLLEEVRTLAPTAVVFMMTGYGDDDMRDQARALGARAIVDKPFQWDALVAMIEATGKPS